ncbi:hypothetical protein V8E36_007601 [Tilletia maclaganii]
MASVGRIESGTKDSDVASRRPVCLPCGCAPFLTAANSLPQSKTEIDCETKDAYLDDIEQDLEDDEIQIIKTVLMEKIPRPLKQEPVLKKEPVEPLLSVKKDPKDEMSSISLKTDTRESLLSFTNRSPATAGSSTSALLASIQDGPRMSLKDWYEEYDVPDRTQAKLEEWGVVNASMIARMTAAHHEAAKLDDVDRLILEITISLWQKAGQATRDGVAGLLSLQSTLSQTAFSGTPTRTPQRQPQSPINCSPRTGPSSGRLSVQVHLEQSPHAPTAGGNAAEHEREQARAHAAADAA